jgi:DNA-binding HxlR family transcriptional regulator
VSAPRTYGEACGIPRALDRVGERWALLIVRELLLGPKRFTDIRTGLPGASPNVLAQRLREMEEAGIVRRRRLPPPAPARVYELTDWGRELEPVLAALGRWGARAPLAGPDACMSFDAHLLSLKTLFDPARAGDLELTIGLVTDQGAFRAVVAEGTLTIERGEPDGADVVLEGGIGALLALAHGRLDLDDALSSGEVRLQGARRSADRFLRLFPLPEPAAVPT